MLSMSCKCSLFALLMTSKEGQVGERGVEHRKPSSSVAESFTFFGRYIVRIAGTI